MKRQSGFTLVELLVVIGIIALLVSILLPTLGKARQQANLTACMAQMRDIGNAISMYVSDNKGSYPGPCLGQVRLNYSLNKDGSPDQGIATYLHRYFKYPDPPTNPDGTAVLDPASGLPVLMPARVFYCAGMRAHNDGTYDENNLCTYVQWASYWDPYPWWGYYNPIPYPVRVARAGTITIVARDGSKSQQVGPMKASQVWEPQLMPFLSDSDAASLIYQGTLANQAAVTGSNPAIAMSRSPNHGGRPEQRQGISELASGGSQNPGGVINGPYYIYTDKTAATNPPRNYLFADGHVQTVRRSEPVLPPQFVTRYGPKPAAGWFPALAVY